jgi:hypothetical protein
MRTYRAIAVACQLSILSIIKAAAADNSDPAEVSFDRGVEHMEGGRFEQACPLIEESYRLDPRPGTLFTLAECEAQRGRIATAVARYGEYLRMYDALPPERRAAQGTREREAITKKSALEPHVPKLLLVLPEGAPAGTIVKRDGAVVEASSLGVALAIDPGEYVVTTQAPGGPVTENRVMVARGERKEARLKVVTKEPALMRRQEARVNRAPPVATQPSVVDESAVKQRRVIVIAAAGAAAAGLGIGVGFTVAANGKSSDAAAQLSRLGGDSACVGAVGARATECKEVRSGVESLETLSRAALGSFIAGGTLAVGAAGLALWTRMRPPQKQPATAFVMPVIGTGRGGAVIIGAW